MALLERNPFDRDAAALGDGCRDLPIGRATIQPGPTEALGDEGGHPSQPVVAGFPNRGHPLRRGGDGRIEAGDRLAAHIHPVEVRRIVEKHAAVGQVVREGDDLQSEERHDAGSRRRSRETAIDAEVVVVRGAQGRNPLGGSQPDRIFGRVERGKVGRQMNMRIDDRPARSHV